MIDRAVSQARELQDASVFSTLGTRHHAPFCYATLHRAPVAARYQPYSVTADLTRQA